MDLSSNYDLPNPFGLLAVDFGHDMDSYRACLGFLGDLATGSDHDEALEANGGNKGMLTGWKRSDKFRRVYDKARKAGAAEREYAEQQAAEAEEDAEESWENEGGAVEAEPTMLPGAQYGLSRPLPNERVFSSQPNRGRWGHA